MFYLFPESPTAHFYSLSLHDALPILLLAAWIVKTIRRPLLNVVSQAQAIGQRRFTTSPEPRWPMAWARSEEHTSELQSRGHLVCRLLLEKKTNTRRHKRLRLRRK